MPIPVTPRGQSLAPVPGWDPADGPAPAPGTGPIIWPPGFSPNPEPTQCRTDVSPPKPIVPPKPDCEQQLKSCMVIAKAQKSIFKWRLLCCIRYLQDCVPVQTSYPAKDFTTAVRSARETRGGPGCLNSVPRLLSGLRAACQRCRVIHGGERRLRRTQSRGG